MPKPAPCCICGEGPVRWWKNTISGVKHFHPHCWEEYLRGAEPRDIQQKKTMEKLSKIFGKGFISEVDDDIKYSDFFDVTFEDEEHRD